LVYSSSRSSSSTSDIDDVVWNMQHHSLWLLLRRCWRETRMNRDTHTHTRTRTDSQRGVSGVSFCSALIIINFSPARVFYFFFSFFLARRIVNRRRSLFVL
jgi:hypothetical protein